MIELTDIAYVRSGVADLDKAVGFATEIVGLELVGPAPDGPSGFGAAAPGAGAPGAGAAAGGGMAPGAGTGPATGAAAAPRSAQLRADWRQHCLALVEGGSGVIASGFAVADEDALAAAETELERAGFTVSRGGAAAARDRRVRSFIGFADPFGNQIELVSQQEMITRPVAFSRPAGITEFGHLCLDAPDVHEAYRFWNGHFNARVSDWIGDAACLIRIDPVHHKLAVFRGDGPGLCHMNFQVETMDDVFRNWHFLTERGVEIEMGPGRHPQSTAVFLYFLGPEGFTYEYSYGVRLIHDDDAWRPRTFDPAEPGSIDMWLGPTRKPVTQPQLGAS